MPHDTREAASGGDLAARFEAKREECEEKAQWDRADRAEKERAAVWREARDMARADAAGGAEERVRHLKRGGEYEVLDRKARLQTDKPLSDDAEVVVYRSMSGMTWVRPVAEMNDGRFETIAPASQAAPVAGVEDTALLDMIEKHKLAVGPQCNGGWVIEGSIEGIDDAQEYDLARTRKGLRSALRMAAGELEDLLPTAPPPPGDAERLDPGAVDAVAEAWASIDGKDDEYRAGRNATSIMDEPGGHFSGYQYEAEELIRRVEKRGWKLVPASLPAGTGSDEEGMDLGAPATPSGSHPTGGTSTEFPSLRDVDPSRIEAAARDCYRVTNASIEAAMFRGWTPQTWEELREHERELHRNYARAGFTAAILSATPTPDPVGASPCHWGGGNDIIWCSTCGAEYAYAKGEKRPACPRLAPTPDPVGEAKALLEGEISAYNGNPREIVGYLRWRAWITDSAEARDQFLSRADRIESALATLRSSQAGEVRDDGDLAKSLEAARAEVARLERIAATAECREIGCDMRRAGGRNAGCDDACCCSVPVYVCTRCGDSDYGDNAEADKRRAACAAGELEGWL